MAVEIGTIVSMPFAENTYVAWTPGQNAAIVIDPGTEPDAILEFLQVRDLTPVAILNTHGHADHIAGNSTMKEAFPEAPLIIGVGDEAMLRDPDRNVSRSFGIDVLSPPADRVVREGETLSLAGMTLDVHEIPGHSPGHVVFVARGENIVFGGDVLFRESIGRTDFPGGSFARLAKGIRDKLYTLPGNTVVYPGHGPVTTIEHERQSNPFVPAD